MADENTQTEVVRHGSLITDGPGENTESKGDETVTETEVKTKLTPGEKSDAENQKVFYGDSEKKAEDQEGSTEKSGDEEGKGNTEKKPDSEAEIKKGDEKKPEENKDDTEFKIENVEGDVLTDADKERIESFTKDQGLSKEAGQKLAQHINDDRMEYVEGLKTQMAEKVQDWAEQVKSDKELGGEKYDQSVSLARTALNKFGSESLLEQLDLTGFGSNPEVVRIFARIGKAIGPDDLIRGGGSSKVEKSMEDVFYGKQQK